MILLPPPISRRCCPRLKVPSRTTGYNLVNMPLFNSVSISGYHMQEDGANAALELAFTIADGLLYVRNAVEVANLKVDGVAPRLSFFWGIRMNFIPIFPI